MSLQISTRTYALAFIMLIVLSCIHLTSGGSAWAQATQLTGRESHSILLADAEVLVRNFRNSSPSGTVKGEFFGYEALKSVLAQPGCVGVRIYYGKKETGDPVLVIVGVETSGADMKAGQILEWGFPCPPICDDKGLLGN